MGVVNAPAIPASTVAQVNTTEENVLVVITGGTMTNVSVNGVTAGAGAGTYLVPTGGSITMTYSVAPTWTWTTVVANPAVPASTVALANPTGQWVNVAISGGTLTFVFVNGVQVGTTAGNYAVPPGGNISITYSVAPTWVWTNPAEYGYAPTYSASNMQLINEMGQLPWPAHSVGGEPGLGEAVSN